MEEESAGYVGRIESHVGHHRTHGADRLLYDPTNPKAVRCVFVDIGEEWSKQCAQRIQSPLDVGKLLSYGLKLGYGMFLGNLAKARGQTIQRTALARDLVIQGKCSHAGGCQWCQQYCTTVHCFCLCNARFPSDDYLAPDTLEDKIRYFFAVAIEDIDRSIELYFRRYPAFPFLCGLQKAQTVSIGVEIKRVSDEGRTVERMPGCP